MERIPSETTPDLLIDPAEFPETADLDLTMPDLTRLRAYRLERVRDQLRRRDLAGCLLFDPGQYPLRHR